MIYEVHRKVNNNIGDYYCNPSRYFNLDTVSSEELLHNKSNITNQTLVIGGGGLIHKKFSLHIASLIEKNPKNVVLWGIGHNFGKKHVTKTNNNVYYPAWVEKCNLIGIRDYIKKEYYLPCVSCMHPAFERTYNAKHDTVYFTHAFKSKYTRNSAPHLKNNEMDFEKVIEFLSSGNTVVTDSYHGAYWAQLLRKNVIVSSWSVKFNHMKYPPQFINSINDPLPLVNNSVSDFLEESRELNKTFYRKFLNLL
jgi:exopolysaccharide biosynthesis predicted pyruvyltransferase EpsI